MDIIILVTADIRNIGSLPKNFVYSGPEVIAAPPAANANTGRLYRVGMVLWGQYASNLDAR